MNVYESCEYTYYYKIGIYCILQQSVSNLIWALFIITYD